MVPDTGKAKQIMENNQIRLQKALSDAGIMSRRKAEEYIQQGRIKVNGHPAFLGIKISPKKDSITIDGEKVVLAREKKWYIALHKPRGYVTTMKDELDRKCVAQLVQDVGTRVYPVGRLDRNSEGLLLLTNDGAFANAMMHPSFHVPKTYRITIRPDITEEQALELASGVVIDGVKTLPAQVTVLTKEPGRAVVQITIYEGRNRQIRKMCEALQLDVARLRRISVGPVKLGMLQPGEWRELTPNEVDTLKGVTRASRSNQRPQGPQVQIAAQPSPLKGPGRGRPSGGRPSEGTRRNPQRQR